MFEIVIASEAQSEAGFRFYSGRLVLGGDLEFLRCAADRWSAKQYRKQWRAAARELATGSRSTSAFVTSVARGFGNLEWWVAERRGNKVVFTNQLLFLRRPRPRINPALAHKQASRGARRTSGRLPKVSAWLLRYAEVRAHLQRGHGA